MIRIYLIVGALILSALGWQTWRANHAVKQLRAVTVERDIAQAQARMLDEARVLDTRIADELAAIRATQATDARRFNAKLDSLKVTKEVPREGDTCTVRDPALYRGLFNEATNGQPAGPDSLF